MSVLLHGLCSGGSARSWSSPAAGSALCSVSVQSIFQCTVIVIAALVTFLSFHLSKIEHFKRNPWFMRLLKLFSGLEKCVRCLGWNHWENIGERDLLGTVAGNISEVPILEGVLGAWKVVLTRNRGKVAEATQLRALAACTPSLVLRVLTTSGSCGQWHVYGAHTVKQAHTYT